MGPALRALVLLAVLGAAPIATCTRAFGVTAPYYAEGLFSVDPGQFGTRAVTTYIHRQGDVSVTLPACQMNF